MTIRTEKVTFAGSQGAALAARLDRPHGKPRACALFAHCFTCSKESAAASRISRALAEQGVAVLRFDFTGLGGSDGEFENTNFSSNVEDLVLASRFVSERVGGPQLMIGHSLGGTAVLAAASRLAEVRAVATINAPFEPAHVMRLLAPSQSELEQTGTARILVAGRSFLIRQQFLEDLQQQHAREHTRTLARPLLIFHAPEDTVVPIDNARSIYDAARHPKSFIALDGAGHLLGRKQDARYVAAVLSAWASRYVIELGPGEIAACAPGEVLVTETHLGKYQQQVVAGRHLLQADEPLHAGGDETGPSPYTLLLAGLGACTSMTLRMYAEHKGLALEQVAVRLTHKKELAEHCEDCQTQTGKVDVIEREVTLRGALEPAQRARMLQIADRCPVDRTLHSEVVVRSRLSD
jgi:uncharacterized OsmC-like protein/alpha-beta hydrolase superfamily lysophospholipase